MRAKRRCSNGDDSAHASISGRVADRARRREVHVQRPMAAHEQPQAEAVRERPARGELAAAHEQPEPLAEVERERRRAPEQRAAEALALTGSARLPRLAPGERVGPWRPSERLALQRAAFRLTAGSARPATQEWRRPVSRMAAFQPEPAAACRAAAKKPRRQLFLPACLQRSAAEA